MKKSLLTMHALLFCALLQTASLQASSISVNEMVMVPLTCVYYSDLPISAGSRPSRMPSQGTTSQVAVYFDSVNSIIYIKGDGKQFAYEVQNAEGETINCGESATGEDVVMHVSTEDSPSISIRIITTSSIYVGNIN